MRARPDGSTDPKAGPMADASAPPALSDEELVERAKAKDFAAFEELVARHEDRVFRLAVRFLRNEAEAQEVAQEAFLAAWRKLDGFKGHAQFSSWLYRVTANAALMRLRSQRRRPEVSSEEIEPATLEALQREHAQADDWSKRPDEQLQSDELRRHIQSSVDGLPDIYRDVFLVRDVEGHSTEETAEMLGVTVPTVKTRLHRARLMLREEITKYFEAV